MATAEVTSSEILSSGSAAPLRMTYEQYLDWEPEGGLAEWVDGEVIIHDMPTREHQRILVFLDRLLGLFVRIFDLGEVLVAPYKMRAVSDGPVREPDLLFVSAPNESRQTSKYLRGPADLAVEIISDDSVIRDREKKFNEYQNAGIREYWIIDWRPKFRRVDFYVLDEQGIYQTVPVSADGIYRSTVLPNFWLRTSWLWQERPDELQALAELVGAERFVQALIASKSKA